VAKIETDPPMWRKVYAIMSGRIRSGEIKVGERVPSLVDLTAEFGIASATGMKVIRQLRADGLIRTEPGIGSKVADPDSWEPVNPA
jgi:GntR family transcriptional regulator